MPNEIGQDRAETISGRAQQNRKRRVIIVTLVGLALLAIVILLITKLGKDKSEESEEIVAKVRVAKVEKGSISSTASALGTIFPRQEATVSARIAGQLSRVPLLKNHAFKQGEVVATIESRDLRAQREEAAAALQEAQLNQKNVTGAAIPQTAAQDEKALRDAHASVTNTRATYERRKVLYDRGGISVKDLEASLLALKTAESELQLAENTARLHAAAGNPSERGMAAAKVKQAEQRLAALDAQLAYGAVRAPFSGVITEQFQFDGEYASPGGKLFSIADMSEVIVKAAFPDKLAPSLKVGDSANVAPQDLPGERLTGQISLVSRAADATNRTVEVWVKLANPDNKLRDDSAALVVVTTATAEDAVVIPTTAVTLESADADSGVVMVVDKASVAHERKVTIGIKESNRVQVLSGLAEGETLVVEGNYALPDGTKVESSEAANESGEQEKENEGEKH
ncbi:MAG TPA: efflux RND transporter periplasmic adaptor subunit [Blastocatellia bacterium]|nr:efflux RND transporter periplasmic adaptor subunit [Blastocatellia bacterium]